MALSVVPVSSVVPPSETVCAASATVVGSFDGVIVTSSARLAVSAGVSESVIDTRMRVVAVALPNSVSAAVNTSWLIQALASATLPTKR
ncbi:hypothetical protein D3C71_624650 [compost metagenome]